MYQITSSIVTYKNNPEVLRKSVDSFLKTDLHVKLYIVDNSASNELKKHCLDRRIEYIFNGRNLGFGAGHNIAIDKAMLETTKYHLVLNPDVCFEKGTLERIYDFMERNRDIGLLMPKICDFDNSTQHLCKLLPAPADLIIRRINSKILNFLFRKRIYRYELRFKNHDNIIEAPHLSGCFMFMREKVFEKVGFFDRRFFMYLEDVDFSRRIHKRYRTVYWPEVVAYHQHTRHSYNNLKALGYHIFSGIKYFNKWGWFYDKERNNINRTVLKKYHDEKSRTV